MIRPHFLIMNWFNPLVWFAAWRLHVERERACDDLVLCAGVRPSTYAGHLVEVVSRLRPAAWTTSCGLAMARKSSLESRLLAVLSERLNRRGVSRVLTAAAIILGAAVAIPVAMLRAADAARGISVPSATTMGRPPPSSSRITATSARHRPTTQTPRLAPGPVPRR